VWIIRWTLIAAIIIAILGISLQNTQLVQISVLNWHSGQIPIHLVIYFSFAAGMVVFLLFSAYRQVQQSIELGRYRKEMRKLQEELVKIRSSSMDLETGDDIETIPDNDQNNSTTPTG